MGTFGPCNLGRMRRSLSVSRGTKAGDRAGRNGLRGAAEVLSSGGG